MNRAFRDIGTCRNIGCENKHGQTVLRNKTRGFSPVWSKSTVVNAQNNAFVDHFFAVH